MEYLTFSQIIKNAVNEYKEKKTIFGIEKIRASSKFSDNVGVMSPMHCSTAQGIISCFLAGSSECVLPPFDGESFVVPMSCDAHDEQYFFNKRNVSSQTMLEEYIKAWVAIKILSKEFSIGNPNFGFAFSCRCDLQGISEHQDTIFRQFVNISENPLFNDIKNQLTNSICLFDNISPDYINGLSANPLKSCIISLCDGSSAVGISSYFEYFAGRHNLPSYLQIGIPALGYEYVRENLINLGYDYIELDRPVFKQLPVVYENLIPTISELNEKFPSTSGIIAGSTIDAIFEGKAAEIEGKLVFPLSLAVARKISDTFGSKAKISFFGGVTALNAKSLSSVGFSSIYCCQCLVKVGGFNNLLQISDIFSTSGQISPSGIASLCESAFNDTSIRKPIKPLPNRKINNSAPLLNCFAAPCRVGCPLFQDIPAYLKAFNDGDLQKAIKIITERNPLPTITGTICPHKCMDKCTRNHCDGAVDIRGCKLKISENALNEYLSSVTPSVPCNKKVAIIGGGPAGLAAGFFLSKCGCDVTIFEKSGKLGGTVANVIPDFRISHEAIQKDIRLCLAYGAKTVLNTKISDIAELHNDGFDYIVLAIGAGIHGQLKLNTGTCINAIDFLTEFKKTNGKTNIGKNVVIIGGGNTAMDAARAAKRNVGVEKVSVVYRRTARYMPADEEELALAMSEGIEFCELASPVGVENGILRCTKMVLGAPDEKGRRSPVPTQDFVDVRADTVISAVGEHIDSNFYRKCGIATDDHDNPLFNKSTMETNVRNVFVIGDGSKGPATVADAIFDAAKVTRGIYGSGAFKYSARNAAANLQTCLDKKGILFPLDNHCHTLGNACLACSKYCGQCVDVCPTRANVAVKVKNKIQIVHIDDRCIHCGICGDFCPYTTPPYESKFTKFGSKSKFESSSNSGFFIDDNGTCYVRIDGENFCTNADENAVPEPFSSIVKILSE